MSDSVRVARGMIANAAALAVSFLLAFLLVPMVVGSLGPVRYGTWVILGTLMSYLGLLDLGLRVAVTTHVARDHAVGNHRGASATLSAALWTRGWIGLSALGGSLLLAAVLEWIVAIPPEVVWEARQALVAYTVALIVSLAGGIFAGVLQALNRQDIVAATTILQAGIRGVGTVVLLWQGYSLVALAVLEAAAALIANALVVERGLRLYPQLQITFSRPPREILARLGTYSGQLVLWQLFERLTTSGPALVIGALLSPADVTFYALGAYLLDAALQVRTAVTPMFIPLATRYEAARNLPALQALLQLGTRLTLLVMLPLLVGFLTRGETFLGVWMGPDYSGPSGEVLTVLTVGKILASAMATGSVILLGLGRQREALLWSGVQAVVTLILSASVARTFGIVGVAWAVTVPTVLGVAVTRHVCRLTQLSFLTYVRTSWGVPALTAVPFAIACIMSDRYWEATSVRGFVVQMAALTPVYILSCMAFLASDLKQGWSMLRGPRTGHVIPGTGS